MPKVKTLILLCILGSMGLPEASAATDSITPLNYIPQIGGVLRARWEMLTNGGDAANKFALRNARVNMRGKIARPIDYYVQVDLCNNGKMQFLDGWARFSMFETLRIKAGQFRIPFGVDPFRGPGNYIFSNRSFIGRYIDNYRAVGLSVSYTLPAIPLLAEIGVFNPTPITDHVTWTTHKSFAAKLTYDCGYFDIATGFQTIEPSLTRINMADFAITFNSGRWLAEAEYMYLHYTGDSFDNVHAYNIYASYEMPVRLSVFRTLSVQARADGSTPYSTGAFNDEGILCANYPARNRITVGGTLTYNYKRLRCDIRLNYEKYLYHSGQNRSGFEDDKIGAELVVAF
ncbi:MAG: OprO/OprP family phosphate-selective porin [Odoribacter sp.]|nr:OprO/OprP family phosphate-selective porin [Odoribacter sp.]